MNLCTQHRFDRGREGLASVEVRGKPASAKSAKNSICNQRARY